MKRYGFLIVLLLMIFGLSGCNSKEISAIAFADQNIEYQIGSDSLSDYDIVITYDNGSTETIKLAESMLVSGEAAKLEEVGDHVINFEYEGFAFAANFEVFQNELDKILLPIYYQAVEEMNLDMTYEQWLASIAGTDGREVVMGVANGYVVWKYSGETSWHNLFEIGSIQTSDDPLIIDIHYENGKLIVGYSDDSIDQIDILNNLFVVNFFDFNGKIINTQIVIKGKNATAPSYTEPGYDFTGWDKTLTNVQTNLNVYPLGDKQTFTVTFETDNGNDINPLTNIEYGSTITLPVPTKEGYDFVGWYKGSSPTAAVFDDDSLVKGDMTLYAKWSVKYYTISFETYAGSVVPNIYKPYGTLLIEPKIPVNGTLDFQGWYTDDTFAEEYVFETMPAENIILYAKWVDLVFQPDDVNNPTYMIVTDYHDDYDDIYVPETHEGYPVKEIDNLAFHEATFKHITLPDTLTTIGSNAFSDAVNLEEIIIPDSVTSLGGAVFSGDTSLANVVLPSGITVIGQSMFQSAESLTSIALPAGLTTIANYAFYLSGLTSIDLPSTVTTIGTNAFADTKLTSVTIPEGVTMIDYAVFANCEELVTVNIPESVTEIRPNAFLNTPAMENYFVDPDNGSFVSVDGVIFDIAKQVIEYYPSGSPVTEYTIPSTVIAMRTDTFNDVVYLTTLNIPDCVTGLTAAYFLNTPALAAINIYDDGTATDNFTSQAGVLYNATGTTLLRYPEGKPDASFTLPASVTEIYNSAFYNNPYLTNLNLGSNLVSIHDWAFEKATGITSLVIPNSVTTISQGAFKDMESLTSIVISNGVTSLYNYTFENDANLTSVTLQDNLTTINGYVFQDNTSLTSIYIPSTVTYVSPLSFINCDSLATFVVDPGNTTYASADGVVFDKAMETLKIYPGGKSDLIYSVPDGVLGIGDFAFSNNKYVETVYLPASLDSLGYMSLSIETITSIYINNTSTVITGSSAMMPLNQDFIVYVPTNLYNDYQTALYWSDFADHIIVAP